MPWSFRRSKKIAPGVRVNLGRRGGSLSLGGKRAGVTIGRRGVSQRVSIPGTGLSHRSRARGCALLLLLPVLMLALGVACGSSTSATPAAEDATPSSARSLAATLAVVTPDEPAFSGDEQTYIDQVLGFTGPISDALQQVGTLSIEAGENNSLILDDDWRTKMVLQLGILKGSAQLVQGLKAPARFAAVQAELTTMALRIDEGATLYAEGIEDLDGDKITQASTKFQEGTAAMTRASQLVAELSGGQATTDAPAAASGATAAQAANLRAGPGTTFKVVGGVKAGDPLAIVGKNKAGDWYQLAGGQWIADFLVTDPPAVPVVEEPAAAAPAPTSVPAAASSPQRAANVPPTAADSDCPCDGNTLNCGDFTSVIDGWEAQACYLHCMELTSRDVHQLDGDDDGHACEWTWSE